MTTSANQSKAAAPLSGGLSFDEAERLSAQFKPSWELDDGAFGEGEVDLSELDALGRGGESAELAAERSANGAPVLEAGGFAELEGGPAAGSMAASDTVIDGVPTVEVGGANGPAETPPAAAVASAAPAPAVAAPPPPRAAKTMMGIGLSDDSSSRELRPVSEERARIADTRREPSSGARRSKPPPASAGTARSGASAPSATAVTSSRNRRGLEGAARAQQSSDSIEIPLTKGPSRTIVKLGAVVVGVIALAFGVKSLMSSGAGEKVTPAAETAPSPVPTGQPTAAPAIPPPPPPKAAEPPAAALPPAAAPLPETAPPAAASPPQSPAPAKPAAAAPKPGAAAPAPAKPAAPKPPTPAAAPAKPAGGKKGGGSIIRETPF